MTFISAALLGALLLASPQTSDRRSEAERLAKTGAYAQALKEFQAIAAANPDDIEARLWIARLHLSMGHPERSADVYQSIVAVQPQNVEALIGLGDALTLAGRFRDASDALNRAEALAADRPAMLTAQGHLHREAGHPNLALAYYQRAVAIEAGNEAARSAIEVLLAERAHRIEGTYDFEHFNDGAPNTHAGEIDVNFRVGETVRLSAGGQHVRKFDFDETRGGAGIEWRARRDLWLNLAGMFAGDTIVIPDRDMGAALTYTRRKVSWLAGVRQLHFVGTSTLVWSPGLTVSLTDRMSVTARYYHSRTRFDTRFQDAANDSVSLLVSGRPGRRVSLEAGFSTGFEALSLVTIERLQQLDAHNLSAGARFDMTPRTSIGAGYQFQARDENVRVSAARLTFVQRF